MELSSEDSFCLNVMLAAGVQAVRIDSNGMTVFGLTEKVKCRCACIRIVVRTNIY